MPSSYKLRLRATPSGSTELSRDGATYLAVLRLVQDRTSLHNIIVPGGGKSGADGGRSLEPWLVRRAAGEGAALHGPGVRRVGLLPGLLLERMLPRGRLLLPGGLPRRLLGGVLPGGIESQNTKQPELRVRALLDEG